MDTFEDSPPVASGRKAARNEGDLKENQGADVADRDTRIEQAEARTEQAEARTEQAKTRTEQAETRTEQAEARTEQAKTRTEQAETESEQAIRGSEMSYRRLFEAARDGILILDIETGRISDANPFLEELLGFSRGDMVGKLVGELSPFKDIESNQAMLEQLQERGYVRYEDLPLETSDGRHIAVEFVSNVYEAGDKKVVQCNIRDITERKQAVTDALWLAAIVESSNDAIIGKDLNGIITTWNKSAERIFGYTAREIVGTSIMRLIPADRYDEEDQILSKITRGENVEHFETQRQTKDGRLIDVSVTISPIKDAAEKVIGVSKMAHDITRRKRAAADLRKSEKEKRSAFEASRLKSEFLANMSHELRTPLNGIIGFTEFLIDGKPGPLNPKQKEYLTDVYNSSKHLLQLINDVLDLAKVEAGKMELNPETFLLAKAIKEVCAVVKGIAQQKCVNIKCTVAPELGTVTLDQPKFKQVCYNLLANAVKFTDSNGSVEITALVCGGDEFEVQVKDTGIGIKHEDMQRLFREFEQLETGKVRQFKGSGLGLALTKKIVEFQGGRIGAQSAYGKGSTFSVVLPRIATELKTR